MMNQPDGQHSYHLQRSLAWREEDCMAQKARVVITGLGAIAPNGIGKEAFWESLHRRTLWHSPDYAVRCEPVSVPDRR